MKKDNQKNITSENIKHLEDFIKKYENALAVRSKDLRLTIEEASLIVSAIAKILLTNNKEKEKSSEKREDKEAIKVDLDFGFFKKK